MDIGRSLGRQLKKLLLGRPLRSDQLNHEKLSVFWGLPIMASDAVSSVAYAIEEILLVLVPALAFAAFSRLLPVVLPILLLLGILIYSYAQIIKQYPSGGGAYIVTQENFGVKTSLLASSTLIIAYVLTVAVSVSSATQAVLSAFPRLEPFQLPLCLVGVAVLTLLNLRGVGEAAKVFGVPTYLFILLIVVLLGVGFVQLLSGGITPANDLPARRLAAEKGGEAFISLLGSSSLFLFLRAFSSGCSALTGVEAVSNAVPLFRDPSRRTAIRVLVLLGGIILLVFGGTAVLSAQLKLVPFAHAEASNYETLLSQLARRVFGGLGFPGDLLYYALQAFTALILLLAANTAYSGLPTLLAILGRDSYLPRHFAHRGAKLSFSNGILFIGLTASLVILLFGAETHRMIPIYAAGVFITFTLSQAGMLVFWFRRKGRGWAFKAALNAAGTLITVVGGATVLVMRFLDGAWLLLAVLPLLMMVMHAIRKRYSALDQEISPAEFHQIYRPSVSPSEQPMLVLLNRLTRPGVKLLNYANSLSRNVKVLSIMEDEESAQALRDRWDEWYLDVELTILIAPFRDIIPPLHDYVQQEENRLQKGQTLTVLLTKFVDRHWYSFLLHNQTAFFLDRELSGHRHVATILVPFIHK
ncbi:MAG: APC family permease [Oscillospiraceae bacterium]|jgi:amino acid transporter|nr:APC family permease [Oscillospiraceae bacterium]